MRPLDLGETLDAAFGIVRSRWRVLAVVMLAVAIPVEVVSFAISAIWLDGSDATSGGLFASPAGEDADGSAVAGSALVATLALVGYLLGTVACYRAVTDTYQGRDTTAGASLRFAADHAGPAVWLMLLVVLGVVAGVIACILPGVWLGIAWSVALPVLLVEGVGGTEALKRSMGLVKDRWWATFGRLFVAYVIAFVASAVVSTVLTLPFAAGDEDSIGALAAQHVAGALTSLITTPFVAAVTALVYFDLRARKEGFDPHATRGEGPPAGGEATPPRGGDAAPGGGPWLPPVPPA